MAMRSALTSLPARLRAPSAPAAADGWRLLSDGKGRLLSEKECAKESIYIQADVRAQIVQGLAACSILCDGGGGKDVNKVGEHLKGLGIPDGSTRSAVGKEPDAAA
nr:hypothetical protein SEVIR_6G121754v2 [Setaria viridis]